MASMTARLIVMDAVLPEAGGPSNTVRGVGRIPGMSVLALALWQANRRFNPCGAHSEHEA